MTSEDMKNAAEKALDGNPRLRDLLVAAISLIDAERVLAQHAVESDTFSGVVRKYLGKQARAILVDGGVVPDYADLLLAFVPQQHESAK
jgi:hypothetical protein